jgi:hypothetical protein
MKPGCKEFDLRKKNNHGCNIFCTATLDNWEPTKKSCKPQSHKSMVVMDPAAELYQKIAFFFYYPLLTSYHSVQYEEQYHDCSW